MNFRSLKRLNYSNIALWVIWPVGLTVLIVFMFLTCSSKGVNDKGDKSDTVLVDSLSAQQESQQQKPKAFRMVEIPAMLTDVDSRAAYLVSHYWDHFDFSDTTYIHLPDITEQAFANYLSMLPQTKEETALSSIQQMLLRSVREDTTGKTYAYFLEKYKHYLADPNSPLRNETYYIAVTEFILADTFSDEATKSRADFDLRMMQKNRPGAKATDFAYSTADKKQGRLYSIKSQYTLLYFYNPDCPACRETTAFLEQSALILHLVKKGMLTVLAVYPDSDLSAWQTHQDNIPSLWINSYDESQTINNKQLYDLKAIPTLYLLDKDKKVLLKDAPADRVEAYLNEKVIP